MTPLDRFEIGGAAIADQIAYYSASNNENLIGAELIKHFIVTLNFNEKELYLTPIPEAERPAPARTFGFDFNRNEAGIYVSKLFKGLSADQAGLELNDTVLSVNSEDLSGYSYCDFYFHIKGLMEGTRDIRLEVKRKDGVKSIAIISQLLRQTDLPVSGEETTAQLRR